MDSFEIQEELGRGTFGVVRKCVHKRSQKALAVKEINMELDGQNEHMVANEIKICKKLQQHARIVHLEDVIYVDNIVYLIFEYLSGGDLFDGILARNWYSEKQSCLLAKQILEALQHCHRLKVIHRDLKPENLLVCKPCQKGEIPHLKLTDFGIACEIPEDSNVISCGMTGSPLYMAPERILERPNSCVVDVWSCGVILFVLLAGYPPFWNEDVEKLFLSIVHGNYSFHDPYWSKVSDGVKDLIRRMLQVDPTHRITAADALEHSWFQDFSHLSSDNKEKTLKTLEAFDARRKLKSLALVLIARKRFSSAVSKKLDKDRRRRTSTSYIPDNELQSHTNTSTDGVSQIQSIHETQSTEEDPMTSICDGIDDLQVTVEDASDDVFNV